MPSEPQSLPVARVVARPEAAPAAPEVESLPVARLLAPPPGVETDIPETPDFAETLPEEETANHRPERRVRLPVAVEAPAQEFIGIEEAGAEAPFEPSASHELIRHLPEVEDEQILARDAARKEAKKTAFLISLGVHVALLLAMVFIVLPGRGGSVPFFVVTSPEEMPEDPERRMRDRRETVSTAPPPKTSVQMHQVVSNMVSPIAMPTMDVDSDAVAPVAMPGTGIGLGRGFMNFGGGNFKGSTIGGMFVRSKKLGVILDVSPSMSPFLDALRVEIRQNFRGSVFREVKGCDLAATTGRVPGFMTFNDPTATVAAVKELVEEHRVDAVYWFCDLQDSESDAALKELEELLRIRLPGQQSVRFYVRSLDEKPSKGLGSIIERSGGELELGPGQRG